MLTGYNSDGGNWVAGLKDNGFDIKDTTVTEIGAGGASTAMLIQAALDGVSKIHMFNRKDRFYKPAKSR